MSILKWQVNSSSNLASFFIVKTHNSYVNFKLIHFLFWLRGSHQSPNFETFECSAENFPNSSCHFPNHKDIIILNASPHSWYIHVAQKEQIKVQIFETFKCSSQNSTNSCHFWNSKSVFLQILHHSSVSWDVFALCLFSWNLTYFQQKEPIKKQSW